MQDIVELKFSTGADMVLLRIIGIILILLGLVFCLTIIAVTIGIPMILIGALLVFVGRKPRPIIVQVTRDDRDR